MRTVWVSFDTIGRDCLVAAAGAGANIVGIVTLPGPVDPARSGQCSFNEVGVAVAGVALVAAIVTIVRRIRRPGLAVTSVDAAESPATV